MADPEPPQDPADASSPASSDNEGSRDTPDGAEPLGFDDDRIGEHLGSLTEEQLDEAPFGIIRVDNEGKVEFYNRYESELSGLEPEEAEGQNFFTQVAPCTNNRLFRGRFREGVRQDDLNERFTYTYTYKMRPTLVDVHLYRDEEGNNWILARTY